MLFVRTYNSNASATQHAYPRTAQKSTRCLDLLGDEPAAVVPQRAVAVRLLPEGRRGPRPLLQGPELCPTPRAEPSEQRVAAARLSAAAAEQALPPQRRHHGCDHQRSARELRHPTCAPGRLLGPPPGRQLPAAAEGQDGSPHAHIHLVQPLLHIFVGRADLPRLKGHEPGQIYMRTCWLAVQHGSPVRSNARCGS